MIQKEIKIDFTSATNGLIALVDNNSDHTPTASVSGYRITTTAHNRESYGTLTSKSKVDQAVDFKNGLKEGDIIPIKAKTMSGTNEISITRKGRSLSATVIGSSGNVTVDVPIPRRLFTPNVYGEQADLLRATLMIVVYCVGLQFLPATVEEKGFKKLRKFLWP